MCCCRSVQTGSRCANLPFCRSPPVCSETCPKPIHLLFWRALIHCVLFSCLSDYMPPQTELKNNYFEYNYTLSLVRNENHYDNSTHPLFFYYFYYLRVVTPSVDRMLVAEQ
jgi:hypothetical protein